MGQNDALTTAVLVLNSEKSDDIFLRLGDNLEG